MLSNDLSSIWAHAIMLLNRKSPLLTRNCMFQCNVRLSNIELEFEVVLLEFQPKYPSTPGQGHWKTDAERGMQQISTYL